MQCDIEPELERTDSENNTKPTENFSIVITISSTSIKQPIAPQPPLFFRSTKIRKRPSYSDNYK